MPVKPNDQSQDNTPPEQPQGATGDTNPTLPTVTPAQASDTTVPGGKYLVNGIYVDANGEPLK